MCIYVKNIPAKFHPDPIWNYEAPTKTTRTRLVAIEDHLAI